MIDSHQHFWIYDAAEYGWIDESMPALRRDFLPPDLARAVSAVDPMSELYRSLFSANPEPWIRPPSREALRRGLAVALAKAETEH